MEHRHRSPVSKQYDLPELHIDVKSEKWWMDKAACKGSDPNLFFPQKGEYEAVKKAKEICKECEVREPCLDYGLRIDDNRRGIYGGMTGLERRAYKKHRNITIWQSDGQNRESA